MKNSNFSYLIREGVRGIFQHGFMSFAAICVTVACLIIVGSFSLILYNVNTMVVDLEKENQILVYIEDTYTEAEAKSVGSQINLIGNIEKAEFVSRQQALEDLLADQGEADMFDGVKADTFRDRYVVTLEDNTLMQQTVAELENLEGVGDVNAHHELAEGFTTLRSVVQIVSIALIAILLVVSLFIISNTVKLAMYDRKEEIAIMKMVGATNGFIEFPFVVQGFVMGAVSAVIAFMAVWGMYDLLVAQINQVDSMQLFQFVRFVDIIWIMIATYVVSGLLVGILGSVMSIRKFLDV